MSTEKSSSWLNLWKLQSSVNEFHPMKLRPQSGSVKCKSLPPNIRRRIAMGTGSAAPFPVHGSSKGDIEVTLCYERPFLWCYELVSQSWHSGAHLRPIAANRFVFLPSRDLRQLEDRSEREADSCLSWSYFRFESNSKSKEISIYRALSKRVLWSDTSN